ncbi:hypothetical protein [Sphingosinicella sp. BN140058]|uniref:hypothetical protein n=1 Tax=Sphingosinicella sp. BN140058 TaxID=1892855 RepID=UPI0010110D94|nr:hypothetical protein [Sphingosinicella sp. BN140058]QAY80359.1 hypothetical protein ETR14_27340 [Sphingosinicella sp. BN140058]
MRGVIIGALILSSGAVEAAPRQKPIWSGSQIGAVAYEIPVRDARTAARKTGDYGMTPRHRGDRHRGRRGHGDWGFVGVPVTIGVGDYIPESRYLEDYAGLACEPEEEGPASASSALAYAVRADGSQCL